MLKLATILETHHHITKSNTNINLKLDLFGHISALFNTL